MIKKLTTLLLIFFAVATAYAQITKKWVATYNGQGDFTDQYTCAVTDKMGNIYLGGSTENPDRSTDYLIVKLSSTGTLLWSKVFNGTDNKDDLVTAITVDNSDYVYVTGYLKNVNTGHDYYTIKMDSIGDTVWTATYNYSTAMGSDKPASICLDASGNVLVTGRSDEDPTEASNDDYLTVKYSPTGTQLWVARYNGTGNGTDKAVKVVADASNNVYVTGRSSNGGDDDYVTIKYNSSGVQQWISIEDGGGTDRATDMVIDASANIYVTGRSNNGLNDDFWTLKYNSAGSVIWQATYDYVDNDRATAIAVDASGNVYVTGESDEDPTAGINWDYLTVMYNSIGGQVWASRFNGTASQYDVPNAIAVQGGNVYVTGMSDADPSAAVVNNMVTVSYNATNGSQNWLVNYNGVGNQNDQGNAVIATSGGCIAAGFSENAQGQADAIAISYNTSGTQQWLQSFNGYGDNNDYVHSLQVDASDNVFVDGYSVEKLTDRNMALVKFNSSGTFVCKQTVTGTETQGRDEARGMILDNSGNPIVGGYIDNLNTSNDIKYFLSNTSNCDTTWLNSYNNSLTNRSDELYDMTRDAAGNIYITGKTNVNATYPTNDDCLTAKISSAGAILWNHTYNNSGTNEDRGMFIKVGSNGNVYVVGRTFNGTDYDILVLCYNNAGAQQWVRTYNGGHNDLPTGMAVDLYNNMYLCGKTEGSVTGINDYITIKYSNIGIRNWVKTYNGPGNGNDEAQAIAVDAYQGYPVVTGKSDIDTSANEDMDMITVAYDTAGNVQWTNTWSGAAKADDIPDAIAINGSDQVYVTGHTNKATVLNPNYDVVTYILSSWKGIELWQDIFNGVSDSSDVPIDIYLKGNDFYVGGYTTQTGQQKNMLVIKYNGTVTGVNDLYADNQQALIYPNPSAGSIHIKVPYIQQYESARVCFYDILGREVLSSSIKTGEDNVINIHQLNSGVYFYTISFGEQRLFTGKVVKVD